jgi:CRISPR-associated protein Csx10
MLNKIIRLRLDSDLCPASGDGFAGYVNADVCFDAHGLPYIPGKRLKGCLRECGLDILSVDESEMATFNRLFGEVGQQNPGTLFIGNGRIEKYEKLVKELGAAHRSELAEAYTSIRSRTRIEDGYAAKGSLRAIRVLNRGQAYQFSATLDEASCDFLKKCVQSLRAMGLNRSRGMGEVSCTLQDAPAPGGVLLPIRDWGEQKALTYAIELQEPVVMTGRSGKTYDTENYLFGSALFGAFATQYAKKRGLSRQAASSDARFRRIFLDGGVRFTAAFPCDEKNLYCPASAFLKTNKVENRLSDESTGIFAEKDEDNPICKRLGGFVDISDGIVTPYPTAQVAFPHHARPTNKAIGHATDDGGDGQFFTYGALAEGQTFAGLVVGAAEDIAELANLFEHDAMLRIGRSRTAQYGKARIQPWEGTLTKNSLTLRDGDLFRLIVQTPVILEDDDGINTTDLRLIPAALGAGYEIVRYACTETTVSGYNAQWLLPRRQERALAEGSTIVLRYHGPETTLCLDFIGLRVRNGFGQVRLEELPAPNAFTLVSKNESSEPDATSLPDKVKNLRAKKAAMDKGREYAEQFMEGKDSAPTNAGLSRMLTALELKEKKATTPEQEDENAYERFASALLAIQQNGLKLTALAFATRKNRQHFQVSAANLQQSHIEDLMEKAMDKTKKENAPYADYKIFLTAAIQRVRQLRRNLTPDPTQKGGENDGSK